MKRKEKTSIKEKYKTKDILRLMLLIVSIPVLLFLFSLYYEFGAQPLIIALILVFASLVIIGPFFRRKKKSHYSRLFPDKIEARKRIRRQREFIKRRIEPEISEPVEIKAVDLDVKYRGPEKPFILKCSKCGMLLPNFLKKCPICKEPIIY